MLEKLMEAELYRAKKQGDSTWGHLNVILNQNRDVNLRPIAFCCCCCCYCCLLLFFQVDTFLDAYCTNSAVLSQTLTFATTLLVSTDQILAQGIARGA